MPFHSPDRLEKLPLPLSFLLPFSPSCNNERKERDLKNRRDDFVAVVAGKIGRPNERSLEMAVSEAEHSPSSTKMYLKQYFRNFKLCACVVIGKTFSGWNLFCFGNFLDATAIPPRPPSPSPPSLDPILANNFFPAFTMRRYIPSSSSSDPFHYLFSSLPSPSGIGYA